MATPSKFDITRKDSMAMPVVQMEPATFDFGRYEAFAAEADLRYAAFLESSEGVAVWQRVRAGEVFRDGCKDMRESLRWQIGALHRTLDFLTDAPTYLEPWYGIGTTAAAFGARYEWFPGQSAAVLPAYESISQIPEKLEARDPMSVPVLKTTLDTIEYFLNETGGRVPMSWCDIQSPINVVGGLVDVGQFLELCLDEPEKARVVLRTLSEELMRFTQRQSELIGPALAKPGHGFASSRKGRGIGLSTDNLVMISPGMFEEFCVEDSEWLGQAFGGTAIHSCGNWKRWLDAVLKIRNLLMIDGAFSPQTDPAYNRCEEFRDSLVGTGVILHARLVGDAEEVMSHVRRLWKPGLKLIVGTHVQNPVEQHALYQAIHEHCR